MIVDFFDLLSHLDCCIKTVKAMSVLKTSVNNILLGLFASSLVILITYSGAYRITKRKTINQYIYYCERYALALTDLIPRIVDINLDARYINYDWERIKSKIEKDAEVNLSVQRLLKLFEESLFQTDGFYPILRKRERNIDIHKLTYYYARFNEAMQFFNFVYLCSTNVIYRHNKSSETYNDEKLKGYTDIIFPATGISDEYTQFTSLLDTIRKKSTISTTHNCDLEKCS
jgi:hypothetical protein